MFRSHYNPLECRDKQDEWMCLSCGNVYCSRYVNQHAKTHWERTKHSLAISLNTSGCYCYDCDDFVDNEEDLSELRQELNPTQEVTSDSEASSLNLEEVSTKSSTIVGEAQETVSTSSCDSGLDSLQSGVNLRPRKRTKSDDDDVPKNAKKKATGKRRGVGLKNLGNTCFSEYFSSEFLRDNF
jgi:uncharacterized UBP type Zn finger protein